MKKIFLIALAILSLTACQPSAEPKKTKEDLSSKNSTEFSEEQSIREVEIEAKRFEFSPSIIRAKWGEKVKVKINNLDTTHNMQIPDLDYFSNENEFILDTSKKGTFDFFCSNRCGTGHGDMTGQIIIE